MIDYRYRIEELEEEARKNRAYGDELGNNIANYIEFLIKEIRKENE